MTEEKTTVKIDGEDAVLHITDTSVMFKKNGRIEGFEKSAIRLVESDGNAAIIAYAVGGEIRSVRVEPVSAVAKLIQAHADKKTVADAFESLYERLRAEARPRFLKIQEDPENESLRITQKEWEEKYREAIGELEELCRVKHGMEPDFISDATDIPENSSYECERDHAKVLYIEWLLLCMYYDWVRQIDIYCRDFGIWPDDWEYLNKKYHLEDEPIMSEKFINYLYSKLPSKKGDEDFGKPPFLY
jgi:hypothetical protein